MKRAIIAVWMGWIGYLTVGGVGMTQGVSNIISIQANQEMWFVLPITHQAEAQGIELKWVANQGDIILETDETTSHITLQRETVLPIPRSPLLQPLAPITLTIPTSDMVEATLWAIAYLQGNCSEVPDQAITRLLWLHCQLAEGVQPNLLESISTTDDLNAQAVGWWIQLQYGTSDHALQTLNTQLRQPSVEVHRLVELLSYKASIHASRFEYDLAVLALETALKDGNPTLEPHTIAKLHKQLGDTLLLLYEWDHVLDHYNQAIRLSPDFADAYWVRAMLYYTKGTTQSALDDFQHYLFLSPSGYYSITAQRAIEEIEGLDLEG